MEFRVHREGVRIAGIDSGPGEIAVLFLHGLAGYSGEWAASMSGLPTNTRSVAFDLRGHGRSERRPTDVSLDAHVDDAVLVVEERQLAPAIVVGQSFGGLVALLLAARRPDL